MNPLLALVLVLAACWNAWLELAARVTGVATLAPLVLVAAVLAIPWLGARRRAVPLVPITLLLLVYVAATVLLPPIFSIAPAALAVAYVLHAGARDVAPGLTFVALVLLALPVVPSLEFFAAYPVRLAAIHATAALLEMNGVAVGVEGLALHFGEQLVQFDAPCSGVRMLWTCWFLASALAHLYGFSAARFVLALLLASLTALIGNILRATSLFYVETMSSSPQAPAWLHEAVGIAAFCMTALAVLAVIRPRRAPVAA